jgi:uncharacterized membrane-anchored protein YhcB (DUF1043 family)
VSDDQVQNSQLDGSQEVERIRDIIFGPQMRDYTQKFQNVQRDLDRLQQELDDLSEQLVDQGSETGKKLQALRREMRKADDGLRDELRQTAEQLAGDKVDREVLGELFIELGNHLKTGGSLADLLKSVVEKE